MMVCIEFRFMNYMMDMTYGTAKEQRKAIYKYRRLVLHLGLATGDMHQFVLINLYEAMADGFLETWCKAVDNNLDNPKKGN